MVSEPMGWLNGLSAIGPILLLVVLAAVAVWTWRRNKRNDRVTEKATRELYDHPERYDEEREALNREVRR